MSTERDSYKQSLKATSLFGGVQIFNILIGIIRSKFIAVFLGPEGMGVFGLLTSTIGLISAFTNLGLSTSAVRDISEANSTANTKRIAFVIGVFQKLVWLTGLFGFFMCIFLSPFLSKITFGNYDYTVAFILLSITLLFNQLTLGQSSLLQGMRRYAYMAKSNIIGSVLGLFITVPLYYWAGIDAIVPVLIISSIVSLFLSYFYSKKVKIDTIIITRKDVLSEGRGMLKMGFFISLQGLFSIASAYFVRIFISNHGGVADVGLYNAGFAIINTYVGLIFTAMGTEYYPRLSVISLNHKEFGKAINQQIELAVLLLAPIISAFIIYIKPVVTILYSSKFVPIEGMIYWAVFAVFFKAVSWAIAFSFLAKGDTKAFFWNELSAIMYFLSLNLLCYYIWGLTGLGVSFLVGYIIYFIQVWIICAKKYQLKIQLRIFKILILQLLISTICIVLIIYVAAFIRYLIGSLLIGISFCYSYRELDKRIEISKAIKKRFKK